MQCGICGKAEDLKQRGAGLRHPFSHYRFRHLAMTRFIYSALTGFGM